MCETIQVSGALEQDREKGKEKRELEIYAGKLLLDSGLGSGKMWDMGRKESSLTGDLTLGAHLSGLKITGREASVRSAGGGNKGVEGPSCCKPPILYPTRTTTLFK